MKIHEDRRGWFRRRVFDPLPALPAMVALLAAPPAALTASAQTPSPAARDSAIVVDTNVAVPMRDGVVLRADVWRPRTASRRRFPVLVYRTPYGKHERGSAHFTARKAVARGYAVVLQDVRGRYASGGEFLPYQQEGADGYDTIEWAARQPWSNGAVGTFGLSYPGAVQWLAAVDAPPHLRAMVPAMTFTSPMPFWYAGGVWDMSWLEWTYTNIAPDRWRRLGLPAGPPWDSVAERLRNALPLTAVPEIARVAPWYVEWLRHPSYDAWWNWADLRNRYGRTNAAVLNFSGWYDEAYGPHGATTNFTGLVASRGTTGRNALIIGPWPHGVPRTERVRVGDRFYSPDGKVDYDEIVLRWMDRYVRGVRNGVDRRKPVHVFLLGSNRWIAADRWPVPGVRPETLYLSRARALSPSPGNADSLVIASDPARPVENFYSGFAGAHDYRMLASRTDVAVFESGPLASDLSIVGATRARVSISVDAPDTDLWVKLYDVAPDGTAYNLMSPGLDVLRASYRNHGRRELLQPGRIYQLRLDDLFTGNTFLRGHRIRVAVMTSFFPDFSRNLHTGALESDSSRMRAARVTVHLGGRTPSFVVLPVLPASAMLFDTP